MKKEIIDLTDAALNGEISNITAFLILDEIEKLVKDCKEKVKQYAYDEVDREPKGLEMEGRIITCQSKSTFKFDHIPAWVELNSELKAIEEKAKLSLKSGLNGNFETGEIIEPARVTYSYFLNIKKI